MADVAINPGVGDRMSREAYRQWAEAQPSGRFERIEGVVVAMAPERLSHANRAQVIHHRRRPDGEGIDTLIVTAGEIRLDPPGVGIMVETVYAA